MGREFIITYDKAKLDDLDFTRLNDRLKNISNDTAHVKFIRQENSSFVYCFKLKNIPDHDWIWDGYFFIRDNAGHLQFDAGTSMQIEPFCNKIKSIFNDIGIQVTVEEG